MPELVDEQDDGGHAPGPESLPAATASPGLGARVLAYAHELFDKFVNDWTSNLVAMVAYNLLTSFVPLILALITTLALVPGIADNVDHIAAQISKVLPANIRKDANVAEFLHTIKNARGLLALISFVGLFWGGTNLFGSIENAFAIIYRVKTRDFLPQRLMALVMVLASLLLLPLSFASSLLLGAASTNVGRIIPGPLRSQLGTSFGLGTSLVALFVLFALIYIVVPNMPVSWRHTWRGALVAAVAMWLVNIAFPFYTARFVSTQQYSTAALGTFIVTITWFWVFSLVLLVGAQVNAIGLGLRPWRYDITRVLQDYASRDPEAALHPGYIQPRPRRKRYQPLIFSGIARDSPADSHGHAAPPAAPEVAPAPQAGGTPSPRQRRREGG